jgi:hypothetical protein
MSDPQEKNQEVPANETFDENDPVNSAWSLDPRKIDDEETKKKAEQLIDLWVQKIQKDVSEMLKEHHVEQFVCSIQHPGSEQLVLLSKGTPYELAVLSHDTANTLKTRVLQRIGINVQ